MRKLMIRLLRLLIPLGVTGLFYFLCRYPLFELHGMKAYLIYSANFVVAVILLSWLLGGRILPYAASLSYGIGFAVGLLLRQEGTDPGGGRTSNLWIIWSVVILICVVCGIAADCVCWYQRRKLRDKE